MLLAAALSTIACIGGGGGGEPAPGPTDAPPVQTDAPDSLLIPSLQIDAPLTQKRLVPGQPLPSPDGQDDVAIYDFGADLPGLGGSPGRGGNVVLSGLNLAVEGCIRGEPPCDAVFRTLRHVDPGADVALVWQNETYDYQVVAMCNTPTSRFGDGLYARTPEEQLTILTGAGNWSSSSGWSHVLIVVAKPAPRTALEPCPEGTNPGSP